MLARIPQPWGICVGIRPAPKRVEEGMQIVWLSIGPADVVSRIMGLSRGEMAADCLRLEFIQRAKNETADRIDTGPTQFSGN